MLLSEGKACRRWSIPLCRKQPHSISVWGIDGHREKHALFSPLLSSFLNRKRKQGSAGTIGRLLFYQHASLQPKAKLKYNTNEDEWLRLRLRCTVVPRVPPTISFSLFSHFWIAKRSQGLALWRRFFLYDLLRLRHFLPDPQPAPLGRSCQLRYGWFLSHLAIRLQLLATKQDRGGHGHLPWEHGHLPPRGSSRLGASAASAVPGERGGPQPVRRELLPSASSTPWPGPCLSPLASDAGWLQCLCRCAAALPWHRLSPQWRRCSVGEPAVSRRWHGRRTPQRGCCAAGLRLHHMAAWMLQLLIATASSVITGRCRQCGHPPLVLSVCSEESSFALFGAVLCFQNFLKICPWMLLFHYVFVVSYCIRNCSL